MEINFKKFDKDTTLDQQRRLFRDCFPETCETPVVTNEHYYWKFHSSNNHFGTSEYGAFINNELVGYYSAILYRYSIDGEIKRCAMVTDVMTDPNYQGKGIFTKLGIFSTDQLANENYDFSTGYPIRPEVIPGHLKAGWKIIFKLPMYLKVIKTNSILDTKKLKFLAPFGNFFARLYRNIFRFKPNHKSFNTYFESPEDFLKNKKYDDFLIKWRKEHKCHLIKDKDFLSWRLSAPETKYIIQVIEKEDQIIAVSVLRNTLLKNVPTLAILDIMVLKQHLDCLDTLHYEIEKMAKQKGAETISVMLSKYWAGKYKLVRNRYLPSPFVFSLIIKQLKEKTFDDSLLNEENWHLMWLDSDDL